MKKTLYIVLTVICFIVTSCKSVDNEEVDELNVKLHQLQEENNILNKKYTKGINENNELLIEIHNLKAKNVSLVNEKEYLEEYYNNIVFRFDKDTNKMNLVVGSHTFIELFGVKSMAELVSDEFNDVEIVLIEEQHLEASGY
ncbi:hypothetical protein AN1V17_51450 [Vallitalea sediminicola]